MTFCTTPPAPRPISPTISKSSMRISSCKGLGARAVGVGRKCGSGRGGASAGASAARGTDLGRFEARPVCGHRRLRRQRGLDGCGDDLGQCRRRLPAHGHAALGDGDVALLEHARIASVNVKRARNRPTQGRVSRRDARACVHSTEASTSTDMLKPFCLLPAASSELARSSVSPPFCLRRLSMIPPLTLRRRSAGDPTLGWPGASAMVLKR